jgi:hypothetical protein
MRAVVRCLGGVGLLILSAVGLLSAQLYPVGRHGFWATLGFGVGGANLTCANGCVFNDSVKGAGATADIKLGGTLNPRVRLGGEINVWVKDVSGVTGTSGETEDVGNVSFAVYFYPEPRSGFFVKGGVGGSSYSLSQGATRTSASGLGFLAGLGYDIHLGGKVSLVPVANLFYGNDGDFTQGGTVVISGIKHAVIDIGLGIQYN